MENWRSGKGKVFVAPETMTAQQLLDFIDALETKPTRRRDLKSAVRCVGRVLGCPLDTLPLDPDWFQPRLDAVIPGAHGLTERTWGKRLSEFGQALKMAGIGRKLAPIPMDGPWEGLRLRMRAHEDMSIICWLSKFLRFCFLTGLQPFEVTFETILAYETEVQAAALNKDPAKAAYYAARMWDKAADTIPGWPQNRVGWVDRRNTYCLPWSNFPASLEADVDAWLSQGECDDIFADWNPGADRKPVTRGEAALRDSALRLGNGPCRCRSCRTDLARSPRRQGQCQDRDALAARRTVRR